VPLTTSLSARHSLCEGLSRSVFAAASLVLAAAAGAAETPLPKGPAPHEANLPLPAVEAPFAPPTGAVHTPPEYARNRGLLLRWTSGFEPELVALAAGVTGQETRAVVTIVVSGPTQQATATNVLTSGGIDMTRVEFLQRSSNSIWIRDYGPRFILEDGELAIVDHTYNRPRPLDDAIPGHVATAWSIARYEMPIVHGGGNFHLFGDGDAFMTELVLDENPSLTAGDVEALYLAYQNLDLTIWDGFPTNFDSTRHIDMWFLPVRDRVAIVGEYPPAAGAPFTITENAVDELETRGYTIFRTPGWNDGGSCCGDHFTYANAVIFNDVVMIPSYTAFPTQNSAAFATYLAAFPGKTIVAIDADDLVGLAGVFHCIVMHVPDPDWLFEDDFETNGLTLWSDAVLEP
jgi:agmatine/peptidylarginine deiminase